MNQQVCKKTLGEAFIQLDNVDLSQQTISWYRLYEMNTIKGSFDDPG